MTVCEKGGGFRPLDNRTIWRLREMDIHRRLAGRQEKYFGRFIAEELENEQKALDAAKQAAHDERMADAQDHMRFAFDRELNAKRHPKMKFK